MTDTAREIAEKFLGARKNAKALPGFPGEMPVGLASAYRVQEQAIPLWSDDIAGWKIGRIPPARQELLKSDRLAGPIFRRLVWASRPFMKMASERLKQNMFSAWEPMRRQARPNGRARKPRISWVRCILASNARAVR